MLTHGKEYKIVIVTYIPSFPAQVFKIQSQNKVLKSPAEGINPITCNTCIAGIEGYYSPVSQKCLNRKWCLLQHV